MGSKGPAHEYKAWSFYVGEKEEKSRPEQKWDDKVGVWSLDLANTLSLRERKAGQAK